MFWQEWQHPLRGAGPKSCHTPYLSLREGRLHILQETGQVLLAVSHHQENTVGDKTKSEPPPGQICLLRWLRAPRRVWKVEGGHTGDSHLSKWFPTTTSFSSTMLGCWSCRSRVISRRLLMGIPGGGRNSRAVRTAWSQSQDRAAPVPPPTSITIFLVVHPHLLQCHCLVRQRVPGTVWGQHRPRWHHTHTSGFVPTPPRPPQPSRRGGTG